MTMNKDNLVNVLLSGLASLNIPGASLAIQYRRTSDRPIDATDTWNNMEDALRYARKMKRSLKRMAGIILNYTRYLRKKSRMQSI